MLPQADKVVVGTVVVDSGERAPCDSGECSVMIERCILWSTTTETASSTVLSKQISAVNCELSDIAMLSVQL